MIPGMRWEQGQHFHPLQRPSDCRSGPSLQREEEPLTQSKGGRVPLSRGLRAVTSGFWDSLSSASQGLGQEAFHF